MQEQQARHTDHSIAHLLQPIAHVSQDGSQSPHSLNKHLSAVEQLAGQFAAEFGAEEWGRLAGRWHDLGKFSRDFQQYIRSASGYEAHLVDVVPGRVNHSSAGALLAREQFGELGLPLAYLIAGHHAGLPDWSPAEDGGKALENRLLEGRKENLLAQAIEAAPKELLEASRPSLQRAILGDQFAGLHLWIRMLFSCLTDADFLDTEVFMQPEKSGLRGNYPEMATLLAQFNEHMNEKARNAESSDLNRIRAGVLRQCREKAAGAPGLHHPGRHARHLCGGRLRKPVRAAENRRVPRDRRQVRPQPFRADC